MGKEAWFRLIAGVIFLAGMSISMRYRRRSETQGEKVSWKEEGWFIMVMLRICGLGLWLSLLLYFVYPQAIGWAHLHQLPDAVRIAAMGVAVVMIPCLAWMFRSIGNNITQTVALRKDHKLVTHGPYKWIRHPLYTFGSLNFIAYAVIAANWFITMWAALGFVMLMVRLPIEEAKLIERFGEEYIAYKKRTGALLPKVFG
ncbi:MAG: isoprenylcysteine carboxylmethyltransferase family protein [Deltaproteobacteria bacterium]|nr:MAG: isoprenylcysteine carboxylmethyltransferase family protein [Deltaproteobacteria bacterium]